MKLEFQAGSLHNHTCKVRAVAEGLQELDHKEMPLITHHWSSLGTTIVRAPAAQPMPPFAPTQEGAKSPVAVEYNQAIMKRIYTTLKQAAAKGCGEVDAASILKQLHIAEM